LAARLVLLRMVRNWTGDKAMGNMKTGCSDEEPTELIPVQADECRQSQVNSCNSDAVGLSNGKSEVLYIDLRIAQAQVE
jgi:hypothetical protein